MLPHFFVPARAAQGVCPGVCASCAAAPSGLPSVAASQPPPSACTSATLAFRRFWRIVQQCLRVGERGGLRGHDRRVGHVPALYSFSVRRTASLADFTV